MAVSSIQRTMVEGPGLGIIKDLEPRHVPVRGWSDARNCRFYRNGTRARKVDGYSRYDTTPGNEPVRLLFHYLTPSNTDILVRVGTTGAWIEAGAARQQIATGLTGTAGAPVVADQHQSTLVWTDGIDPVKKYVGSGLATDLAGLTGIRAKILVLHKSHLLLFNIVDHGIPKPWRMLYSAPGNIEDYTADTAGDLDFLDIPGEITAAKGLGDNVIVHQANGLHRLAFIGGDDQYIQEPLPGEDGAISRRAIVRKGAYHYFMGHHNFYRLGAAPETIGNRIWPAILHELGVTEMLDFGNRHLIFAYPRHDWEEIHWKLPRPGAAQPDLTVMLNLKDGSWALADHDPATCFAQYPPLLTDTWDLGEDAPIDQSADIPWDYAAYSAATPLNLFGQASGHVQQYGGRNADGAPISAYLESRLFAAEDGLTPHRLFEVPILAQGVGTLRVQVRTKMSVGGPDPAYPAARLFPLDGSVKPWVDIRPPVGRYYQIKLSQTGLDEDFDLEAYGVGVTALEGIR
jgi:hypothetical protein